jgi:hypothetical protein
VLLGANFLSIADGITGKVICVIWADGVANARQGHIEEIEAQKLVEKMRISLEEVSVVGSLVPN